jgi:hypothetical protein
MDPFDGVPKRRSIGLIELFRKGPWQIVVLAWLLTAGATAVWVLTPWTRISATANWRIAAAFGAALGFVLARPATARYFAAGSRFAQWLVVGIAAGTLAIAAAQLAPTHLGPLWARATADTPLVVMGESKNGRIGSWGLPLLLWLLWCNYILRTFPPITKRIHDESSSAWDAYKDAVGRLGQRVVVTIVLSGAVAYLAYPETSPGGHADTPDQAMVILTHPVSASLSSAERAELFQKVETERQATEGRIFSDLANLDLEAARSRIDAACCGLVLPGAVSNPELMRLRAAFRTLDQEIAGRNGKDWKPSDAAVQATVSLLPMNADAHGAVPACPKFWRSVEPKTPPREIEKMSELNTTKQVVNYRGVPLLDVRLSVLPLGPTESATVEVAIQISGTVGGGTAYIAEVQKKLGQPPTDGPMTIGNGAMCARWNLDAMGVRIGPAVSPQIALSDMTPRSALWLTCYAPSLSHVLTRLYQRSDGYPSFDPHGCGYLPTSGVRPKRKTNGARPRL